MEHGPNYLWLPPDLIDGEEEYEVEAILRHCGKPGCHTFLVRWKGYSTAENTWKPEQNLTNSKLLFKEYKITQPMDFPEYNHHHKARKQKTWIPSPSPSLSSPLSFLWLPSLDSFPMCCGILWTLTPVSDSQCLGMDNRSSHGNCRTLPPIGRTCGSSLITA